MRFKLILSILVVSACSTAYALDVNSNKGGLLQSLIGDNTNITTLKVSGEINAVDLDFINSTLISLTSLDISQSTITASSGIRTSLGKSDFNADELPAYALFGSGIEEIILPADIKKIGEGALANSAIASIALPASVTTVDNYAFTNCNNLTEISVPNTVLRLGIGVWKDCSSLRKATIYSQLDSIGASMFEGCSNLTDIFIQPTYKSLGNNCFINCTSLADFTFPSSLATIGDKAFYNSGITAVRLNECSTLSSIGNFAFAKCSRLESVTMGNTAVTLGKGLFFDDTALHSIQLPASTDIIPAFTFKGTTSIDTENALPDNTRTINDYALYGWEHAETFILPADTEHIGSRAMAGWTSLKELNAEKISSVPTLGTDTWEGINQADVYLFVNDRTAEQFKAAEQWKNFKITIGTTGVDSIIDDTDDKNANTNVDFHVGDGYIKVVSHGANIAKINIYDLNGRNRYTADTDSNVLSVSTVQWNDTVLIVYVQLADNTHATIKLSI